MGDEAVVVPEVRIRRRDGGSGRQLAALMARRLGITLGEVLELLERLPFGEDQGGAAAEAWLRPEARNLLERYAARKRAIARLAVHGQL